MKMTKQVCRVCKNEYPLTRDYFGNTPSGNFRLRCRKCMASYVKSYSDVHKDGVTERNQLRKTRESNAGGNGYSENDVYDILRRLQHRCAYCDCSLDSGFHVDHMVPVAQGGKSERLNMTVCCVKCNLAKHAKNVEEYFAWRVARKLPVRRPRVV